MSRSINNGSSTHVRYAHTWRPRDLDVVCPRCGGCAHASKVSERDEPATIGVFKPSYRLSDWTIACAACPHRATGLAYDDLPALFWTVTVGQLEIWAWNREHLVFLSRHLGGEDTKAHVYAWFATYIPGAWQRKRARVVKAIQERLLAT